jgi:hypothetical protein
MITIGAKLNGPNAPPPVDEEEDPKKLRVRLGSHDTLDLEPMDSEDEGDSVAIDAADERASRKRGFHPGL